MIPTVITLSSIPPRFSALNKPLNSLLAQTLPATEIRLYIPRRYRRFPDWDGTLPDVPEGITILRCETDYGPATKLLPALEDLAERDVHILFCDDDKIYDHNWHQRFKDAAARLPDTCIAEAGSSLPDVADSSRASDRLPRGGQKPKTLWYRIKRALTLTLYKPHLYRNSGYIDQFSGYGGVLVKPNWLDDEVYNIPEIMWTVDDPWISGHLERNGIPVWLNGKGKQPGFAHSGRKHALRDLVVDGYGRVEADLAVIEYMRENYGIWSKNTAVEMRSRE